MILCLIGMVLLDIFWRPIQQMKCTAGSLAIQLCEVGIDSLFFTKHYSAYFGRRLSTSNAGRVWKLLYFGWSRFQQVTSSKVTRSARRLGANISTTLKVLNASDILELRKTVQPSKSRFAQIWWGWLYAFLVTFGGQVSSKHLALAAFHAMIKYTEYGQQVRKVVGGSNEVVQSQNFFNVALLCIYAVFFCIKKLANSIQMPFCLHSNR